MNNSEFYFSGNSLYSEEFGDIYYSREGGCAEKRHVFMEGNALVSRWSAAPDLFVIAELGFGTGLNFILTADLYLSLPHQQRPSRLVFMSVEKKLLPRHILLQVLDACAIPFAETFLGRYTLLPNGLHSIFFDDGRIELRLLVGEAERMQLWNGPVDAWYLDGFSPQKNPEMWSESVFKTVGKLSRPNATVATYTVSAMVRERLRSQGFITEKVPGFGRKKEMLVARREGIPPHAMRKPQTVAIIGGGIAGCLSALALERRGYHVHLFESRWELAAEGSGNRAGMVHPHMSGDDSVMTRLNASGYSFTVNHLRDIYGCHEFHQTGLLNIQTEQEEVRMHKAIARYNFPAAFIEADGRNSWLGFSGFVQPSCFCESVMSHPGISIHLGERVENFEYRSGEWELAGANGILGRAEILILANAAAARRGKDFSWLPLREIKGQVVYVPSHSFQNLAGFPVSSRVYTIPLGSEVLLGATFEKEFEHRDYDEQKNFELWEKLEEDYKSQTDSPDLASLPGRVGFRAVTYDRLPLVGRLPREDSYSREYVANLKARRPAEYPDSPESYFPDLYILSGLGARGLVYGPLLAEQLAADIAGEPYYILPADYAFLNPGRFLIRNLRRQPSEKIFF